MGTLTIKDVARAASVSVATVSRVLNGHSNVTAEVRDRVLRVAHELRYTPHAAARSLSSRRNRMLGVVLPDLYGEFFSELVRGVDQAAREHGLHLLVSSYHGDPEDQGAALRAMRGRVDGLLVMSPYVAAPAAICDLAGLPVVLINSQAAAGGISNASVAAISVDNHGGAMAMVKHLFEGGHRQIAFIAGPADNFDAHERLRGYRDALAQWLPHAEEWTLQGDFDEASGHRAGIELAASPALPDAVFAANDMMALGCLFALSQSGIRVPDDVALAGFDDIPLARYVHPGLTTMRVNIAEVGDRAVRMLLAQLGEPGHAGAASVVMTPDLIVRESCALSTSHPKRNDSS